MTPAEAADLALRNKDNIIRSWIDGTGLGNQSYDKWLADACAHHLDIAYVVRNSFKLARRATKPEDVRPLLEEYYKSLEKPSAPLPGMGDAQPQIPVPGPDEELYELVTPMGTYLKIRKKQQARLVDMTASEFKALVVEAVREALK